MGEPKPITVMPTRFPPGQLVATPGALEAFRQSGDSPLEFLMRHLSGDWGELDAEDRKENVYSLEHGLRLLSAYRLKDGTKIWVITEADRSATTILLPSEY
jgi:hypothetical protein